MCIWLKIFCMWNSRVREKPVQLQNHVTPIKRAWGGGRFSRRAKWEAAGAPAFLLISDSPKLGTQVPAWCAHSKGLSLNSLSVKFIFHLLIGIPPPTPAPPGNTKGPSISKEDWRILFLLGFDDEVPARAQITMKKHKSTNRENTNLPYWINSEAVRKQISLTKVKHLVKGFYHDPKELENSIRSWSPAVPGCTCKAKPKECLRVQENGKIF